MRIDVYLLLIAPVVLSGIGPSVTGRLAPQAAARALTVLSVVAATCVVWALAVLAIGGLGRTSGVQDWLHSDPTTLTLFDPVPRKVGVMSALMLSAVVLRAVLVARRRGRDLRALAVVSSELAAAEDLVIVADGMPDAYAVPGAGARPGRIVVTSGMLTALPPSEHRAVLAHERAHLTHRHHTYVTAGQLAMCLCPPLGRVNSRITFSLERWADEEAAQVVGDRRLVARALARAALAMGRPDAPRFRQALGYVWLAITDRTKALKDTQPVSHWRTLWPVLVAAVLTGWLFTETTLALFRCVSVLS